MWKRSWLVLLIGMICIQVSAGDSFPARPIKIIVPASPGGGTDQMARLLAKPLSDTLMQPVIVENRPGAAGNIGADLVAKAAPDGHTLLLGHNGIVGTNPHMGARLSYDVLKDLVPVAPLYRVWSFLYVPANSPHATLKDLIRAATAKPGTLNYGSSGIGSLQHVGMAWMEHILAIELTHVPYKGSAPAITALLAGEIDVFLDFPVPAVQHVKAGKLRVLGAAAPRRREPYPDVATLHEQGAEGFALDAWVGLFAPARTPKAIVDRLNREVANAMRTAGLQAAVAQRGAEELTATPESFSEFVRQEYVRGAKLVKISGAKDE